MDYAQDQKSNWVNFNSLQLLNIQNWNHISKKTEDWDSEKSFRIDFGLDILAKNFEAFRVAAHWTGKVILSD